MNRVRRSWIVLLLGLALLGHAFTAEAFETDQYDLPPIPLADIGDEVSDHVARKLREAIDKINSQIREDELCLKESAQPAGKPCKAAEAKTGLEYLRSSEAVAHAAYSALGAGIPPFSIMETWMEKHRFQNQPARYKVGFWKSIFFVWPFDVITISPTVNLYGSEFGTDKFGHLFQQGYTYYKIYNRALAEGAKPEEARQKAVYWGQMTEETIYGKLITLVYSNGDLFANYVGMKFYEGLTKEIKVGTDVRPAIFILKNGLWAWNERVKMREVLVRPLISGQLNEALNPSIFTQMLGLRWYVRRKVANRSCTRWFNRYPTLSRAGLEEKSRSLQLWYGEDYGFTKSEHFITIANTCFEEDGTPRYRPEAAKRKVAGKNQSTDQRD